MREAVDVVVAFSPVGGGHRAAAIAVAEAARKRGLRVAVLDAFAHAPKWAGEAYIAAHLAGQNVVPDFYGRLYANANRRGDVLEPLRLRIDNYLFGALVDEIRARRPKVVVATHHLPLVVCSRARLERTLDAPVLGIVTDYTTHACWAESGIDRWAVACEAARDELAAHGVLPWRIATTGIPVRAAFETIPGVRHALGERLRVLVTSGAFGARALSRILESFRGVEDVDLTVICGASAKVEERVRRAAIENGLRPRILGFERDMAARIAENHILVGKAGGLTVTEAMTAGRPMVIASAVPGNEKRNERRVVRGGAGLSADPSEVGVTIDRIRAAGLVEWMGQRARALVPRGAADRVVDEVVGIAPRKAAA